MDGGHSSVYWVGIDLHQETVALAVLKDWGQRFEIERTMPTDLVKLGRFFSRLAKRGEVRACYEAGGCGYVLQRCLARQGVHCDVIAPSLIPKRSGDRRKTDPRDACKLARLYRAGELTPILVPSEAEERVRELVRCRDTFRGEVHRSRQHVLKLLQRRGLGRGYRVKRWTTKHWRWLRQLELEGEDHEVLQGYLALLDAKQGHLEEADRRVEAASQREPWCGPVGRLRCMRGIDTLTAMTLATEVVDVRRFASARRLMGYFGLTVSESSSGGRQRLGGITKAGSSRSRRVLVEAAWNNRLRPYLSEALKRRQRGHSPDVIAHAWRAQRRLHKRYRYLGRRKDPKTVVTAMARELVGFVWALMHEDPGLLIARTR